MQVKNLCFKHHKKAPYFFQDLNFCLESGQFHALHGQNGVGKSVLFNILSRRIDRDAVVQGQILTEHSELVDQKFDSILVDRFTFLENLKFAVLGAFPNPFAKLKAPSFLPDVLEKFHIDPSLPVYQLSGGQRQILALLMKMQKKTKVLLLDEPTAAMDEQNAHMVFEFLSDLKDVTKLIVCHDRALVERYASGQHLILHKQESGLRTLSVCQ